MALFGEGKIAECIARAKHNLTDPTLPPYYVIQNCILVAGALDDWDDADYYRLAAEQACITSLKDATEKRDENLLEVLTGLRTQLDQLNEFRQEDMAAEHEDMAAEDEDGDEDEEFDVAVDDADMNEVETALEMSGTAKVEDGGETSYRYPAYATDLSDDHMGEAPIINTDEPPTVKNVCYRMSKGHPET